MALMADAASRRGVMNSLAASPDTAGTGRISRRALLGAVPFLPVLAVEKVSAQHQGHTTVTDSTARMRAAAAEHRTWLGVRLAVIGIALALYLTWWRHQVVKERRARLRKEDGRSADPPAEQPRLLPRQRRRH
jgi:hypothetical protein